MLLHLICPVNDHIWCSNNILDQCYWAIIVPRSLPTFSKAADGKRHRVQALNQHWGKTTKGGIGSLTGQAGSFSSTSSSKYITCNPASDLPASLSGATRKPRKACDSQSASSALAAASPSRDQIFDQQLADEAVQKLREMRAART